jgi:hypothetical protein
MRPLPPGVIVLDLAVRDGDHHIFPVVSVHVDGKDDLV